MSDIKCMDILDQGLKNEFSQTPTVTRASFATEAVTPASSRRSSNSSVGSGSFGSSTSAISIKKFKQAAANGAAATSGAKERLSRACARVAAAAPEPFLPLYGPQGRKISTFEQERSDSGRGSAAARILRTARKLEAAAAAAAEGQTVAELRQTVKTYNAVAPASMAVAGARAAATRAEELEVARKAAAAIAAIALHTQNKLQTVADTAALLRQKSSSAAQAIKTRRSSLAARRAAEKAAAAAEAAAAAAVVATAKRTEAEKRATLRLRTVKRQEAAAAAAQQAAAAARSLRIYDAVAAQKAAVKAF